MINPIFKDKAHQQQFDRDGFIKITLVTNENIVALKALFHQFFPNPSKDFYSSSYDNNYELKKEISDSIGEILQPNLEKIFIDYKWFGSAFLSKGNGPRSEMPMHQDWTIVDETQYIALNIWTPLQDTNEENGSLEVIKGSHKWQNILRAPTLPFYFDGYQKQLKEKLTCIPTLATEAIVLNQAIIHYSKPNKTNDTRIAITSGIKSINAPMIFHYWNKNEPEIIEQFKQDDDFLLQFIDFHKAIFLRPQMGESIGKLKFNKKTVSENEIEKLLASNNKSEKSFSNKILQWFRK